MLVARNGGSPPLTMVSFCKLVDRVGDPLPPAPDPPAAIPGPAPDMPSTDPAATEVPTWQEVGFKEEPATIFKVGGARAEVLRRSGNRGGWRVEVQGAGSSDVSVFGGQGSACWCWG
jgi:hypothetical protein